MTHVVGGPVWAERNRLRSLGSFALFLIFATAGGAAAGAFLGLLLPRYAHAELLFALPAAALVLRDWFRLRIPLPQIRLQAPQALKSHQWLGPPIYGSILGSGVLTYLPSAIVYVYILGLLLLASPLIGALVGATFGASYALAVLVLGKATCGLFAPHQAAWLKQLFGRARGVSLFLTGAFIIVVAGCAADRQPPNRAAKSCNASGVDAASPDGLTPEVRGSMPGGYLSATFALPDYPGVPNGSRWVDKNRAIFVNFRGKPIKLGFLVTGSGPLKVVARGPDGSVIKPSWGPKAHLPIRGRHRPGDPWGAGFVFGERGCWKIDVQRGGMHGRIVFLARS